MNRLPPGPEELLPAAEVTIPSDDELDAMCDRLMRFEEDCEGQAPFARDLETEAAG